MFDEGDTREVILTGFNGRQHDHSLHSVTGGPDGLIHFNQGNTGADFTSNDGKRFQIGSPYAGGASDWDKSYTSDPRSYAGTESDDGKVWVSGFSVRMNPDGTDVTIVGHGYRNSYEQTIDSRGEMFNNENDDLQGCTTAFVPEGAFFGFCSRDGKRTWQADQNTWQTIPEAHWRQGDPGVDPAGDVYGAGAPTGITWYENGALGEEWNGTLLSADAARNVVFSYQPEPDGAGYVLEHEQFLTSNPDEVFAGIDHTYQNAEANEAAVRFRPSDVLVSPDGAIYVCDWYDGRVGGHADWDESCSGTIYRIAPVGFTPDVPEIDLSSTEGALTALASPAVNVRWTGFQALEARGAAALAPVQAWMPEQDNPLVALRGLWLLPRLGEAGLAASVDALGSADADQRMVAVKALFRLGYEFTSDQLLAMTADSDARVARAGSAVLVNLPLDEIGPAVLQLARRVSRGDRAMQAAFYRVSQGREDQLWDLVSDDPQLSDKLVVAATIHPAAAVADLVEGVANEKDQDVRHLSLIALASTPTQAAAEALISLVQGGTQPLADEAKWLLISRSKATFGALNLGPRLVETAVWDPANAPIASMVLAPAPPSTMPSVAEVMELSGNVDVGREAAQRCVLCHQIEGRGPNYGPSMTGWGATQSAEAIAQAILQPSADIAHGFDGEHLEIDDGAIIVDGIVLSNADPLVVRSMGGLTQFIPKNRISKREPLGRSLMFTPEMLGLTPQDVRNIVEFLRSEDVDEGVPAQ